MPTVRLEHPETVANFGVAIHNLCMTIKSAGITEELHNSTTIRSLTRKMSSQLQMDWMSHVNEQKPNLSMFDDWLQTRALAANRMIGYRDEGKADTKKGRVNIHDEGERKGPKACLTCDGECKSVASCKKFQKYELNKRWQLVKRNHLCRTCLLKHKGQCNVEQECGQNGCKFRHHKLLHNPARESPDVPAPQPPAKDKPTIPVTTPPDAVVQKQFSHHRSGNLKTLFRIVPVVLRNGRNELETFAFLDEGSSITLLEDKIAEQLNLKGPTHPLCLQWTGDTTRDEPESMLVSLKISGISKNAESFQLKDVRTVNKLSLPQQSLNAEELAQRFSYLRGLPIKSYENAVPTMLIGLDNWKLGVPIRVKEGSEDHPIAAKSRLGWVIFGPMQSMPTETFSMHFHHCDCRKDEDLHQMIREAIDQDNIGIIKKENALLSPQERRAIDIQTATTKRIGDRFQTGLLWAYDKINMPDSYSMAKKRALCAERSYTRDPLLRLKVNELMTEYQQLGFIRKLSKQEELQRDGKTWYLPLFATTNPNKPGKVRMVWDGAAKVNGISLNSMLLKGPDQMVPLLQPLLRFRQRKVGVWGDICKMFHQIRIDPADQNSQRFLHREDDTKSFDTYVLEVMTFGASCSPSSAHFVKNLNARDHLESFPKASKCIIENHFVDDMLDSCDTAEEAIQLAEEVRNIHSKAGFVIRNFKSNLKEVEDALEGGGPELMNMEIGAESDKILGMWFEKNKDCFTFSLKFQRVNEDVLTGKTVPTKREVLRILMSVFDPAGHLAHFTIHLKILLQDIWRTGRNWDERIPNELQPRWFQWITRLQEIERLKIPRCFLRNVNNYDNANIQLHVLTDASAEGRAAVAYLRIQEGHQIDVSQVAAKSKVAPLKLTSIPRLELEGALLGARLAQSIREWLSIDVHSTHFWTDSKTVLSWIRSDHRRYKPFVAFRTTEIQDISDVSDWHWVPTKHNVADEATKSSNNPCLDATGRWFAGPEFLQQETVGWEGDDSIDIEQTQEEIRVINLHVQSEKFIDLSRFSKWQRLLRSTAYVHHFIERFVIKPKHLRDTQAPLSSEELRQAELTLFRMAQKTKYSLEIDSLQKQKPISKRSSLYNVTPYLDSDGILRVQGRIDAANIDFDTKRPIILPGEHRVTNLLIQRYHDKFLHQHHEVVVNELRKRFHIPKMRRVVKKVVAKCQFCRVYKAKPVIPRMASLPQARLAAFYVPFTHTGVDYFGPIEVVVRRSTEKRWGVLFVCMTTRAVHIEIAHTLNASSCIMSIRNFIQRRGRPKVFYSDCGTNFIATERILKEEYEKLDREAIYREFTSAETEWRKNPPAAPHFGGSWERKVGAVKKATYASLPTRNVTDEILRCALMEAENIVNSTPLTYLPIESPEMEALTPNHFLRLASGGAESCAIVDHTAALVNSWKTAQLMADTFWKRWVIEYLPTLTRRDKWIEEAEPIEVGSLVLIVDPANPRNQWPRGVVIEVVKAKDGNVRQAVVQTTTGIYKRPVAKLAVLTVKSSEDLQTGGGNVGNKSLQMDDTATREPDN